MNHLPLSVFSKGHFSPLPWHCCRENKTTLQHKQHTHPSQYSLIKIWRHDLRKAKRQLSLTSRSPFCSSAPVWFKLVYYPSSLYLIADVLPIDREIVSLANEQYIWLAWYPVSAAVLRPEFSLKHTASVPLWKFVWAGGAGQKNTLLPPAPFASPLCNM